MKVKILEETLNYNNVLADINDMLSRVDEISDSANFTVSHIVVDGVEVFKDLYDYISENLLSIKEIQIVHKSQQQIANDSFCLAEQYLDRAIPLIDQLVKDFYKGPDTENWADFERVLEAIQWFNQLIVFVENQQVSFINRDQLVVLSTQLNESMKELESAVIKSDVILIADILNYELKKNLEALLAEIRITLDNEVVRHDLN